MAAPVRDNRPPKDTGNGQIAATWPAVRSRRGLFGAPLGLLAIDVVSMAGAAACVSRAAAVTLPAVAMLAASNIVAGLYRPRLMSTGLDGGLRLAACGLVAAMVATSLAGDTQGIDWLTDVLMIGAIYALLAACFKGTFHSALRRRGAIRPTLIIGAGEHGQRLATALLDHREYGLQPIGFVDGEYAPEQPEPRIPVLGGPDELGEIVRTHGIHTVIVALATKPEPKLRFLTRQARDRGCVVFIAPDPGDVLVDFVSMTEHVRSLPMVRMRPTAQSLLTWPLKRLLDVVAALFGMVVTVPIMAMCALAVRWESGPGVLFRQDRVGLGGRRIEMLKWRTLKPASAHESATRWNIADDQRIGPVGRVLRKTSLDELPQLWNVVRGEMTIVGPRPERPFFVDQFSKSTPHYELRHRVPVGITGWAQVHGLRGDTSIEERARFDNYYIDNWSFRNDIKIIILTVWSVLRSGGA